MSIELVVGPMFSGKTSEMFRRVRRRAAAREKCMIVRWHRDDRYSGTDAATHDGVYMRAVGAEFLSTVETADVMVIGIDEGQFYSDLYSIAIKWRNMGIHVIIAALDGTFERKPFGQTLMLVPEASSVIKLTAICVLCGKDAPFTRRINTDNHETVVIGGADKYAASCYACLARPLLKRSVDEQQERLKLLESK